jgi:N-formylglutamate deformylase
MHLIASHTLHRGHLPLLISLPHVGTLIPADLRSLYTPRALEVEDTDWHLATLYDFARERGASMLVPTCSRYVIDLNRPPDNRPMYPGANNTELCPTRFFSGESLYKDEQKVPGPAEVALRRELYWQPYHDALAGELARLKQQHGHAVLFDGHSIKSELPWLFEGQLPDLNLGTASGTSCAASLRSALAAVLEQQDAFSQVADGRFKGGYITRHYGQPHNGIHAVQLEMGLRCYMEEKAPFVIDPARAAVLAPVLGRLVDAMLGFKPAA